MKRVVSISLGTSTRNKTATTEFMGTPFVLERIGTDGSTRRFQELVAELDGKVDCFGVGGTDAYLYSGSRRYAIRQTLDLMKGARVTPWVDGSGLKHTLERETVAWLQDNGVVDFASKRVLIVVGVDRFGMAEAVSARARSVVFGDAMYALGLPLPLRSLSALGVVARTLLPIIVHLPIQWLYPTGKSQEVNTPRFTRYFDEADVIAGDWHVIRRYMPLRMEGKIILTQSSRAADVEMLRQRGVSMLVTTTPEVNGEAFATNLMEAALVVTLGRRPESLTPDDYLGTLRKLGWAPGVKRL